MSDCSGPGQSSRIIGSPPALMKRRRTSATMIASSSCPGDGDEVRDEIEGQAQIGDKGNEQQLAAPGHAGIACEAGDEHDAVRDECGECPCVVATTADDQPGEERAVDRKGDPE